MMIGSSSPLIPADVNTGRSSRAEWLRSVLARAYSARAKAATPQSTAETPKAAGTTFTLPTTKPADSSALLGGRGSLLPPGTPAPPSDQTSLPTEVLPDNVDKRLKGQGPRTYPTNPSGLTTSSPLDGSGTRSTAPPAGTVGDFTNALPASPFTAGELPPENGFTSAPQPAPEVVPNLDKSMPGVAPRTYVGGGLTVSNVSAQYAGQTTVGGSGSLINVRS